MKRCDLCGTENLASARYCDECGTPLENPLGQSENESEADEPRAVSQRSVPAWAFDSGSRSAIGHSRMNHDFAQSVLAEPKNEAGEVRAVLTIERGKSEGKEFWLGETGETQIGRWDADNGIFPDVDLDAHDPEAKVSRRHAKIIRAGENFLIEDLGSTNGTFVNRGRRLPPNNRLILNHNDEIIVGKTFLRFKIVR